MGKTGQDLGVVSRLLTPSLVLLIAELLIAHISPSSRKVIAHFPNIEDSSSTSSRDESSPAISLSPFVIAHFSGRAFSPTFSRANPSHAPICGEPISYGLSNPLYPYCFNET
ncbi:hypothetical protein DY000_02033529 [Brassica cretica]|uniref:Uncharacterized protein n=1 Tax=Brassica cretica TaxID=69181 RepID=A0ABQ7DS82_BRACR|nr:hypothetical protein DY000_02033529 [Brassica cretica]